jgi:hypothetical protein
MAASSSGTTSTSATAKKKWFHKVPISDVLDSLRRGRPHQFQRLISQNIDIYENYLDTVSPRYFSQLQSFGVGNKNSMSWQLQSKRIISVLSSIY